jgi:putative tryptophan/tyrosine transport system substrate-binding protein
LKRREFITLLGGAAAWPLAARAQEAGRIYRLGFLIPSGRNTPGVVDFFDELRLNGFIEGQNLTVIPNGFDVRNDQLAERAAALVKAAPDAIVGGPELPLRALQALTTTIPLISMTEDMVAAGLVASLARPGGNTTGISLLSYELDGKRQDILMEAAPGAHRMAALFDSNVTPKGHIQVLQDAARVRGVDLSVYGIAKLDDIACHRHCEGLRR